jgi:hypothetical protein
MLFDDIASSRHYIITAGYRIYDVQHMGKQQGGKRGSGHPHGKYIS